MQNQQIRAVGIMSGTSLDGLDIVQVTFSNAESKWNFTLNAGITIPLPSDLKKRLLNSMDLPAIDLAFLDRELGAFIGKNVKEFLFDNKLNAELIGSHGHTVFHQPESGLTLQIGSGAEIAVHSGIPVICDFRTTDVAKGGQGAPLVPIGDKLLFPEYQSCLNLGGIANVSMDSGNKRIAYDISACNMILNRLAGIKGLDYDKDGALAKTGVENKDLLQQLDELEYYRLQYPKSLGKEWVDRILWPMFQESDIAVEDKLRTFCVHIGKKIGEALPDGKCLVTGGGAHNSFLLSEIKRNSKTSIEVPDRGTVECKEALIFAFLGALRWNNEINTLSSVTGASGDSSSGCIYLP